MIEVVYKEREGKEREESWSRVEGVIFHNGSSGVDFDDGIAPNNGRRSYTISISVHWPGSRPVLYDEATDGGVLKYFPTSRPFSPSTCRSPGSKNVNVI